MDRKKVFFSMATLAIVATVEAFATTTGLSGTSGAFTATGTDTYGFKEIFVKAANVVSDDGLNKIVGFGGTLSGAVMAYNKAYVGGGMVALVSMIVGFLPKVVDGLYGAMI